MAGSVASQEKDICLTNLRLPYRTAGRAKRRLQGYGFTGSGFIQIVDTASADHGQHAKIVLSIEVVRYPSTRRVKPDR